LSLSELIVIGSIRVLYNYPSIIALLWRSVVKKTYLNAVFPNI
jgi:hypothetical protein